MKMTSIRIAWASKWYQYEWAKCLEDKLSKKNIKAWAMKKKKVDERNPLKFSFFLTQFQLKLRSLRIFKEPTNLHKKNTEEEAQKKLLFQSNFSQKKSDFSLFAFFFSWFSTLFKLSNLFLIPESPRKETYSLAFFFFFF